MGMRYGALLILCLALSGCANQTAGVVLFGSPSGETQLHRQIPNLALGQSRENLWVAAGLNYRSGWPSVTTGYRLDEVTYHMDIQEDDQFYFGRFGGYYRTTQTVSSAVIIR